MIRKYRIEKMKLIVAQVFVLLAFLAIWEYGTLLGLFDEFIFSRPSLILKLLWQYIITNKIWDHLLISILETVLGIVIGSFIGIIIAIVLWSSKLLSKIMEPFLVLLNALPKTALAPIMIIWAGTGISGVVAASISILVVVTIISTYNYFINVDDEKIKMLKSFGASKTQLFTKLIFPSNLVNLINVIKINIGLAWVGVIVGEFLVSKAGIGHLIMYGGQTFRFDLVMMGVLLLCIIAYLMYALVNLIEKYLLKKRGKGI